MSYEKFVMDLDHCGMMLRLIEEIETNSESMGRDAHLEAGPGQSFLSTGHTLRHFATANYPSELPEAGPYETWMENGARTLEGYARGLRTAPDRSRGGVGARRLRRPQEVRDDRRVVLARLRFGSERRMVDARISREEVLVRADVRVMVFDGNFWGADENKFEEFAKYISKCDRTEAGDTYLLAAWMTAERFQYCRIDAFQSQCILE